MHDLGAESNYDLRNVARARGSAWHVYRRLLRYTLRYKGRLAVSLFFALVVAVSFTSMIFGTAAVVNVIFAGEEQINARLDAYSGRIDAVPEPLFKLLPWSRDDLDAGVRAWVHRMRQAPMRALVFISIVVIACNVLAGLARFLQEYYAGTIGANISVQLGQEMFENVVRLPIRFFEEHTTGELLARFTNDIFMVNRGLAGVFVKLMREPIKALFFLGVALSADALLTGVGLLVLPPVAFVIVHVGNKFKKNVRRSLQRIASMASVGSETFRGMLIVKGFCMEEYETRRVRVEMEQLRRYLNKMVKADAAIGPLVEMVLVFGVVGFVLLAGQRVATGLLPPDDLVKLFTALALMLDPVRKLASVNNMIMTSVASAERVFEFIDWKPDIVEKPGATDLPPLRESLRFENVHFSYDGDAEVLAGIDFTVRKGEMVALVGFSGVGKSTLVKLLPRFYDVTGGAIRIDGVDVRDVTFASLRDQISLVTQETILFDETVRDIIAFGRDTYSDERIRQAARAAHATEFIERLPQRYDTRIGESGATLSGGQRQRLAIARAIIKDPAILILDEATSSLDSESEREIQKAIEAFVRGRTAIVIAHRLSTVQRADRILVLDEGRIVEEGTHQELLAKGGIYSRLYEIQFAPTARNSVTDT